MFALPSIASAGATSFFTVLRVLFPYLLVAALAGGAGFYAGDLKSDRDHLKDQLELSKQVTTLTKEVADSKMELVLYKDDQKEILRTAEVSAQQKLDAALKERDSYRRTATSIKGQYNSLLAASGEKACKLSGAAQTTINSLVDAVNNEPNPPPIPVSKLPVPKPTK